MPRDLRIPDLHLLVEWEGKPLFIDEKWLRVRGSVESQSKFQTDVDLLVQQIRANGFESAVLVLDGGDKLTVLDGFRRCFAYAEVVTQMQDQGKPLVAENGKPLELRCEVYDGEPSDDAIVARIVRSNLARSNLGEGERKNLILAYLKAEAARGIHRTTNWVAADLGVSQRWLAEVRKEAVDKGALPWRAEYEGRDGRKMPSGIDQPRRKNEGLPASSTTSKDAATSTPARSGASAADTETKTETGKDAPAPSVTASMTTPATSAQATTSQAGGPKETPPETPRYIPEQHPATEAVCALVKDSQRPPKEIDPEGRLGVEGLVDRHDIDTPLGRALSEYLDPLFSALGIDLDLALRHFVAMLKDAVARKEMAAKEAKRAGRRNIRDHVGPALDLFLPAFSTTGPVERAAAEVVLLDAMRSYFEYAFRSACGIPAITLEGTTGDWEALAERAEACAEFELETWIGVLRPILRQFVRASQGDVETPFWRSLYKEHDASGGRQVTGWMLTLFPYLKDGRTGRATKRNPWLDEIGEEERGSDEPYGPTIEHFPGGLSKAPFRWHYLEKDFDMEFLGGFVGVAQDPETLALRPEIGWAVREAGVTA